MIRTKEQFERLIAELDADMEILFSLGEKNVRANARIEQGAVDELDWAALGYTIHNIYNAMEGYFLRVAKFFENMISPQSWHRELLDRMSLAIPNVRPAFLRKEDVSILNDLRSFRHIFRNIYNGSLDPEKTAAVQKKVSAALALFRDRHESYRMELSELKALVNE
jgi:hypothetical protein